MSLDILTRPQGPTIWSLLTALTSFPQLSPHSVPLQSLWPSWPPWLNAHNILTPQNLLSDKSLPNITSSERSPRAALILCPILCFSSLCLPSQCQPSPWLDVMYLFLNLLPVLPQWNIGFMQQALFMLVAQHQRAQSAGAALQVLTRCTCGCVSPPLTTHFSYTLLFSLNNTFDLHCLILCNKCIVFLLLDALEFLFNKTLYWWI